MPAEALSCRASPAPRGYLRPRSPSCYAGRSVGGGGGPFASPGRRLLELSVVGAAVGVLRPRRRFADPASDLLPCPAVGRAGRPFACPGGGLLELLDSPVGR